MAAPGVRPEVELHPPFEGRAKFGSAPSGFDLLGNSPTQARASIAGFDAQISIEMLGLLAGERIDGAAEETRPE